MVHRRWWFVVGRGRHLAGGDGARGGAVARCPPSRRRRSRRRRSPRRRRCPSDAPVPQPPALPTPPPVPTVPVPEPTAPRSRRPVRTPAVSGPSVSTPSVSTPAGSVPSVSTPRVSTPAAGARAGSGSAPSDSGGSARERGIGRGRCDRAPHGATPGGSRRPARARGARAARAARAAVRPAALTATAPPRKARRRDRALRRAVLRFQGCLSRVPRAERRVLTLRAGVGAARTHSRTEVARITHLRRARVIRLERRGLRRLHALGRAGACQDAEATSALAPAGTGTTLPPGSTPGGASRRRPGRASLQRQQGRRRRRGIASPTAELSISRPAGIPGGGSFDLALVLAPLAVLAFLLV